MKTQVNPYNTRGTEGTKERGVRAMDYKELHRSQAQLTGDDAELVAKMREC